MKISTNLDFQRFLLHISRKNWSLYKKLELDLFVFEIHIGILNWFEFQI